MKNRNRIILYMIVIIFAFSGLALLGLSIFLISHFNVATINGKINIWFSLVLAFICLIISFLDFLSAYLLLKRNVKGIIIGKIASISGILPGQSTFIAFVIAFLLSVFGLRLKSLFIPGIVLVIVFGIVFLLLQFKKEKLFE